LFVAIVFAPPCGLEKIGEQTWRLRACCVEEPQRTQPLARLNCCDQPDHIGAQVGQSKQGAVEVACNHSWPPARLRIEATDVAVEQVKRDSSHAQALGPTRMGVVELPGQRRAIWRQTPARQQAKFYRSTVLGNEPAGLSQAADPAH
jgi:hypothetical protein